MPEEYKARFWLGVGTSEVTATYNFASAITSTKYDIDEEQLTYGYKFELSKSVLFNNLRLLDMLRTQYPSLKKLTVKRIIETVSYILTDGCSWMGKAFVVINPDHRTYYSAIRENLWKNEKWIVQKALQSQVLSGKLILHLFRWSVSDKRENEITNECVGDVFLPFSPALVEFEFGAFYDSEVHIYTARFDIEDEFVEYDLTRMPLRKTTEGEAYSGQLLPMAFLPLPDEFREIKTGWNAYACVLHLLRKLAR